MTRERPVASATPLKFSRPRSFVTDDVKRHFFFPARVDDVSRYVAQVVAFLGERFDGALAYAAVGEALLNGILYGALGVEPEHEARDPVAFVASIREAERLAAASVGVAVTAEVVPGAGGHAAVRVSDTGHGFDWHAACQRLSRSAADDLAATSGRGLRLMRAGALSVIWNDVGNEVTLTLAPRSGSRENETPDASRAAVRFAPFAQSELPSLAPQSSSRPAHLALAAGRARVLIVDDVETNRQLLRLQLEAEGYSVLCEADGVAALERVASWKPHLAVVDFQMPRMSGLDVVRRMAERGLLAHTSVVLLTASEPGAALRSAGIEAGACDFLQKPISRRELVARIRRTLAARQNLARLAGERDELRSSVTAAASVMEALMPAARVECPGATVTTLVAPCRFVGGDVVDVVQTGPASWCVLLLDVAGHGLAAALTAAASRAILRDRLVAGRGLGDALAGLNARLSEDLDRTGQHAAVAAAHVDLDEHLVHVINAGCPPVALFGRDGGVRLVHSSAPPTGLVDSVAFRAETFPLASVARLVIVSDGITERVTMPSDTLGALRSLGVREDDHSAIDLPRESLTAALTRLGDDRDDASIVWVNFLSAASTSTTDAPLVASARPPNTLHGAARGLRRQ